MRKLHDAAAWPLALLAGCGLWGLAGAAGAQILPGDTAVELELVTGGLVSPVMATHAGDGSGRLFVVDQVGQIRIVENGVLLPTPFLDLSGEIVTLNPGFDERGVLGLAFHPDYAGNGRFFVRYSVPRAGAPDEPCSQAGFIVGCHAEVLAEFGVSGDPNVAVPTGTVLFSVDEPQFNHDGGGIAFGPDGLLYFGLGDGGGANDGLADTPPSHGPIGNGQNTETTLGAILRIDVDGGSPYAIPPDNPFAGGPGADEIYAYGMRNPYRFSFDRADGRLFAADVGQNLYEEIDVVVNGGNYGWVIREGFDCFDPFSPNSPPASCPSVGAAGEPLLDPVAAYDHGDGIAVVGGYVYRGSASPGLVGKYLFGDWSLSFGSPAGRLFYLEADGDLSQIFELQLAAPLGLFVMGFGEDEAGEIYVLTSGTGVPSGQTGQVYRITQPATPVAVDIKPGSCPNSWNRRSHGVLPVAVVGTAEFDVGTIDASSVVISRADGVGGSVGPNEGRGPGTSIEDVATPFGGETCDCHELEGDGVADLSLKFRTDDVVAALALEGADPGELVELVIRGVLSDGTPFEGSDCVRLVPPGTPPGRMRLESKAGQAWFDASPPDEQLDGGGFGSFERTYPQSTVVSLGAPARRGNRSFRGWRVDGGELIAGTQLSLAIIAEDHVVEAVYSEESCGLGFEVAPLLLLGLWAQRRRLRTGDR